MKKFDITRPDRIFLSGLKTLGDLSMGLYPQEKSIAKSSGEITFIGKQKVDKVEAQLYKYNEENINFSKEVSDFSFFTSLAKDQVYWLNFHGLHEIEPIQTLAETLSLDRITVRQTLDTTLRPKVEEYEHYLFFSVKSVLKDETGVLKIEQLSFVLGQNYVISFQEEAGDHFDHIRNKIDEKLGLIRKKGADFLVFQLLDAILDNYFETIENINTELKLLEKVVLTNPKQDTLIQLEQTKQTAEMIKKSLNPFKESLRGILNRKIQFISEDNTKYYQDLMSNCHGAIEEIEATSRSLEGLTNIYFSSLSQKMNETMKVLTTVATIFIPLTFIAGIYGMNFENMPELKNPNGYYYTWGFMGLVFIGMIVYFRRKNWL
ncbi:MAG: magnesium/cobalt transporter CorA [Cyclobacteriaceae bacterium]